MENASAKATGEGAWSTTASPLTPEEEDTIITLVVVIVGVMAAIILLFSMGIFIDCKTQKANIGNGTAGSGKRRRLRLKMPPIGRAKHQHHQRLGGSSRREDSKCLAADMCPPGSSDAAAVVRDVASTTLEAVV